MKRNARPREIRLIALLLLLVHLFALVGCSNDQPVTEETSPTSETEVHSHSFVEGVCECGESNGFDGFTVQTDNNLTAVVREDTDSGMVLTSANPAGEMQGIQLNKEIDAVYGNYYEIVYSFTSNVAGKIRFVSDNAAYYESNEYEVKAGENEITVRFAAGDVKDGKANTSLELGGLDEFSLTFTSIICEELKEDMSTFFLDVAPEKASGTMELTEEGYITTTYKTDEGWRVKLAVDRNLEEGKTYETTFVFTKSGGRAENVTYTVYDGAATMIGSKTKWIDSDLCVATFYFTANETVTKGTCLELGQLCDDEDVSLTFTYIDFKRVDPEKLEALLTANPFTGVNVWTEGSLTPAAETQSADGLTIRNTNPATDWWKVKLEKELPADKDSYYKITFKFESDTAGKIKFVNDDAVYYGSNEYDVKQGDNVFTVEIKSGGNSYSCLELGGLGPCELVFTDITVEKIDEPQNPQYNPDAANTTPATRFSSFGVWTDGSMQKPTRKDTATTMTLTSKNVQTDWWKIKLEKDINGKAGKCYEVVYKFKSDTAGRIKFVNDDATYFGSNEYDVVVGENTFTVRFKYAGKPYSCLELGGLGQFQLVFKDYTIKEIKEPEVISNGFESYRVWTEDTLTPAVREDTANSMIVTSANAACDWWWVKVEKDLDIVKDHYYEMTYKFTSDKAGTIQFVCDGVQYLNSNTYNVIVGENTFTVQFKAGDSKYSCLELGNLGEFRLEFTGISLTEIDEPEQPEGHTHNFVNGVCSCSATNGFAGVRTQTDGSVNPITRKDTENTMTLISENAAGDWWKVKLEMPLSVTAGKEYEASFSFTSNASGTIKYHVDGATFPDGNEYSVQSGSNTFTVHFTAGAQSYSCLELGGLGQFELVFTSISVKEVEHTHSFENGKCSCGTSNGFAGVHTQTDGSVNPITRKDTENTMTLISENAAGDWWKVKLEMPLSVTEGKKYEVSFSFTSNTSGRIKYSVNDASFLNSNEYDVQSGANKFTVQFTAGAQNYSCLELGGLGNFNLTFTGISVKEIEEPASTNTAPEITGVSNKSIVVGTEFDALAGVTATDAEDGDISEITVTASPELVFVDGKVTPTVAGTYELTYSVKDSGGLTAEAKATLTVTEDDSGNTNTAPQISGVSDKSIVVGTEFDALAGVTATDAEDGAILKIEVTATGLEFENGKVKPTAAGTYELIYSVKDSGGLTAEAKATLTVTADDSGTDDSDQGDSDLDNPENS